MSDVKRKKELITQMKNSLFVDESGSELLSREEKNDDGFIDGREYQMIR